MSKKNTIKNVLLSALITVIVLVLIAAILGFAFLKLYIEPKYKEMAARAGQEERLPEIDFLDFAKYLTDRQFVENLKNFDRSLAGGVLSAMLDLDAENAQNPDEASTAVWDEALSADMKNIKPTKPHVKTADIKQAAENAGIKPSEAQETAYDRITAAASKEEIAAGMAILSKISVAKVNELQAAGKTEELKTYIKSCLTSAEISTSLQLYNKYKHLL